MSRGKRPQCTFAKEQTHPACHALIAQPPRHKTLPSRSSILSLSSCRLSAADGVTARRKLFFISASVVAFAFTSDTIFLRVVSPAGSTFCDLERDPQGGISLMRLSGLAKGHGIPRALKSGISPAPPCRTNCALE